MPTEKEPIPQPESAGESPAPEEKEGFAGDLFSWLQALSFALLILS